MKTLYLGLELPENQHTEDVTHFPIIKIVPRDFKDPDILKGYTQLAEYTHIVFTSKAAVSIFLDTLQVLKVSLNEISNKTLIAVGKSTAKKLQEHHLPTHCVASEETAEGITKELNPETLKDAYIFLPQSAIAKPTLRKWFEKHHIRHIVCSIYDTLPNLDTPLPDLSLFDQIYFTSPSTVDAFVQAYGSLPKNKTLLSIGSVTKEYLNKQN